MPRKFCGRFTTPRRCFACATSWPGRASARACASGCSTRCATAASSRASTATATASRPRVRRRKKYRIGYASQGQDSSFVHEVHRGLARGGRTRADRADRRRQPLSAQGRAEERRAADQGRRRPGDRIPDRRIRGAGDCREVPRSEHPADCDRHSASGCDLFRRQQLRGRSAGGPASRALGAAALARRAPIRSCSSSWRVRGRFRRRAFAERWPAFASRSTTPPSWPVVSIDGDGQFKTSLERVRKHLRQSKAHAAARGVRQRSERARRRARVSGGGTRRRLRHRRTERGARRSRRAAAAAHAARRVDRVLP